MKSVFARTLTVALLAGSLLGVTAAYAHPHDYDRGRDARASEHRGFEGRRDFGRDRPWRAEPRDERRWVAPPRGAGPYAYRHPERFAPHFWRRGEFLPVGDFGRGAWIADYRFYGLRPPPPGCAWVAVGDDFVLTAIATGLVVDVVQHLIG